MDSIIAFSIMRPANITGNLLDSERSRRQGKEGKGKKKKTTGKRGKNRGKEKKKLSPWSFLYQYLDQLILQTQKSLTQSYSLTALGLEDLMGWPWVVWFCPALTQEKKTTAGLGMVGRASTSNFFLSPAAENWKAMQIFIPGDEEDRRGMQHGS